SHALLHLHSFPTRRSSDLPVAVTRSHPAATPMGWDRFAELCRRPATAVYALGGMRVEQLPQVRAVGAHGLAMISGIWEAADIGRSEEHTSELQSRGHLVCR